MGKVSKRSPATDRPKLQRHGDRLRATPNRRLQNKSARFWASTTRASIGWVSAIAAAGLGPDRLLAASSPPPFAAAPGRLRERLPRSSPPADLAKTLGGKILRSNGFVNRYSQVKWIFSTKMALHKALVLFKLNSHAEMAPDTAIGQQAP